MPSPQRRGGRVSDFGHLSIRASLSFVLRHFFQRSSFVAQCFNRIERGGLSRWIKAEENSHGGTEKERQHDRPGRNQRRPMLDRRKNLRGQNAENNAEQSANGTERNRFDQELGENIAAVRAHCRSEEHTSELQSPDHLVCRLLLEKKKKHI